MEAPSLAEALSEDTHFRPTSTNPLTQGVRRFQDLEMKRAARDAAKEKAAQHQKELIASSLHAVDQGKTLWNAPAFKKVAENYVSNAMNSSDQLESKMHYQKALNEMGPLNASDANITNFINGANAHEIHGKEAASLIASGDKKGFEEYLKKHPETQDIFPGYDPEKPENISPQHIPVVNFENQYNSDLTANKHLAINPRQIARNNLTQKVTYESKIPESAVNQMAESYAGNTSNQLSTRQQYPERFNKLLQAGRDANPNATNEQLYFDAAKQIHKENIEKKNSFISEDAIYHAPASQGTSNFNIDFGNNKAGSGTTIKKDVAVPDGNGGFKHEKQEVHIDSGGGFGFKRVKVLNPTSDNFINLDKGGKRIKGQAIQDVETGRANDYPVAKKDFKNHLGVVIHAGEIVDEKQMQSMIDQDAVEYKPFIEGQASVKNVAGKTVQASVLIPAEEASRSVLISQSKDDQQSTYESINKANENAKKRNSELHLRKSGSSKPAVKSIPKKTNTHGI